MQVRNASSVFTILTLELLTATGTHGFNYISVSAGDYISIGDVFSLDKTMYPQGSMMVLVPEFSYGQYCVMYVQSIFLPRQSIYPG